MLNLHATRWTTNPTHTLMGLCEGNPTCVEASDSPPASLKPQGREAVELRTAGSSRCPWSVTAVLVAAAGLRSLPSSTPGTPLLGFAALPPPTAASPMRPVSKSSRIIGMCINQMNAAYRRRYHQPLLDSGIRRVSPASLEARICPDPGNATPVASHLCLSSA
jgi:hypothetical protein